MIRLDFTQLHELASVQLENFEERDARASVLTRNLGGVGAGLKREEKSRVFAAR